MSVTAQAIAYRSRSSLRIVSWASIAYLGFSLIELVGTGLTLASNLQQRHAGIQFSFDPGQDVSQPADHSYFGAPYVVPGSSITFDHATAQVANLPVETIVLKSAGEALGILTGAGVALCVLLLAGWILRGRPFVSAAVRVLVALALVVMIGFPAASVLDYAANNGALDVMYYWPDMLGSADGLETSSQSQVIVSFTPFYIGLALLGLAAAFRVGASLEKDTEGLV